MGEYRIQKALYCINAVDENATVAAQSDLGRKKQVSVLSCEDALRALCIRQGQGGKITSFSDSRFARVQSQVVPKTGDVMERRKGCVQSCYGVQLPAVCQLVRVEAGGECKRTT